MWKGKRMKGHLANDCLNMQMQQTSRLYGLNRRVCMNEHLDVFKVRPSTRSALACRPQSQLFLLKWWMLLQIRVSIGQVATENNTHCLIYKH